MIYTCKNCGKTILGGQIASSALQNILENEKVCECEHPIYDEEKIPEINLELKEIKVEAKSYKLKGWYSLNRNGSHLLTKYKIVYWWYKFWWWIKPPKIVCYYGEGIEEELEKAIEKQIK